MIVGKTNAYLAKRRATIEHTARKASDMAAELTSWLAVVALNEEFGFGPERCERFMNSLAARAETFAKERAEDDDVAMEYLRRRLEQILRTDIRRVE